MQEFHLKSFFLTLVLALPASAQSTLARQVADGALRRWPEGRLTAEPQIWQYQEGTLLAGITAVWQQTGEQKYYDYLKSSVDHVLDPVGTMKSYRLEDFSQDQILMGRQAQLLCGRTHEQRYCKAVETLHEQLLRQPRTASGGFWHKGIYPQQMWLDGLYMAEPFRAEYAADHHQPRDFADIAHQFLLLEQHARDPRTGLLYHGWDEAHTQPWAYKSTGLSPSFWARGMGWYAMALVDTLPYFPSGHPDRPRLLAAFNRLMTAVVRYQDPETGVWWEVMDRPHGPHNFLESSASSMFVYALDKGMRLGYLPSTYHPAADKAWSGIVRQFVEHAGTGEISVTHIVKGAGLGGTPYRSGTYDYYAGETVVADEPKGIGAFLLAAAEAERTASSAATLPQEACNPRDYGAKADGITKDTAALQQAIDACAARPQGGTVPLTGGTFLSAPIVLRSNVTLAIAADATLLGSSNHADYPAKTEFRAPGYQSLVSATDAENIRITGAGTIDGAGKSWWDAVRGTRDAGLLGSPNTRPRLIVFDHCRHVLLEGVSIKDSPYWQVVPYYTDDITIRNVRITADEHSPNTDAIDPFSSSNVHIEHVYASVGDDNIAIKSGIINSPGPDDASRNITITDCDFAKGHGLSIGSELSGGAQHIHAERIHFHGTDNGVRVKANRDRGGNISDITFKDITMEDVKTSILISEYYPKALPEGEVAPAPLGRLTPFFADIHIENLRSVRSDWAGVIIGLPESLVKSLTLTNVDIQSTRGLVVAYAQATATHVTIAPSTGQPVTVAPNATFTVTQ